MRTLLVAAAALAALAADSRAQDEPRRPNVVLIYTDDVGFGDVGCYGASGVPTPNVDRLAAEGLRFTDAHCTAATCTPSRYSLLTGEYAFRKRGTGVLPGSAAMVIEPGRTTLASVFGSAGYKTAVVGKWHLGLGAGGLDWNGAIRPGPQDIGFAECFLLPATGDRVPCVYVEGERVVGLDPEDPIQVSYGKRIGDDPIGAERPDLLKMKFSHGHDRTIVNGISRIGYMTGGHAARWVDEDMADRFVERALQFLDEAGDEPFFLYFATHDVHVPRVPHPRFVGKTDQGARGDVLVEMDWCVGALLDKLDELGVADDTIVIFTSDNGPVLDDGYVDEAVERIGDHRPAGSWRGGKYSSFEAGTRVPHIVRWPARVEPGVSPALLSQVDYLASFAALLGIELGEGAGPDSLDQLGALLGEDTVGRDHLVSQAGSISLREGGYKFIPAGKGAKFSRSTGIELGNDTVPQLYDLATDPGETNNLAESQPERVKAMAARLDAIRGVKRGG
jgi:arylsulfatase A-like enzyme